ncbi:unnamed protein product [Amoebophrya sp. A25]|nr:unnamed protein product [Amoebophrya sp. A25]|eukprot:GSA25T00001646001.1
MQFLRSLVGSQTSDAEHQHQPTSTNAGSPGGPLVGTSAASSSSRSTNTKVTKYVKLLHSFLSPEDQEYFTQKLRQDSADEVSDDIGALQQSSDFVRIVDLKELARLLWSGAPGEHPQLRATTWRLLLGIAPNARERHHSTLARKRREYHDLVNREYNFRDLDEDEQPLIRQIRVDLPRTSYGRCKEDHMDVGRGPPDGASSSRHLLQEKRIQQMMERILFVWAIRRPACGYVQGINDLLPPFLTVFLAERLAQDPTNASFTSENVQLASSLLSRFSEEQLADVEADTYLCLSKLLDSIQDHYTPGQPGIQRMMQALKGLIARMSTSGLGQHLEEQGIEMVHTSFRWFNCLLTREMPLSCTIRLFDTYIAELHDHPSEFDQFLTFLVSSFLIHWETNLREMDFQQMILFLQQLPTEDWKVHDIEYLLTKCHITRETFAGATEVRAEMMRSLRP